MQEDLTVCEKFVFTFRQCELLSVTVACEQGNYN
jgi:hypothetical protein